VRTGRLRGAKQIDLHMGDIGGNAGGVLPTADQVQGVERLDVKVDNQQVKRARRRFVRGAGQLHAGAPGGISNLHGKDEIFENGRDCSNG